jgi:hypothetical protein
MPRNPLAHLVGTIGKYSTPFQQILPSSLHDDFRIIAKGVTRDALARSLTKVILSPNTASLPYILAQLYEHSNPRIRAKLLKAIFPVAPKLLKYLPDAVAEAPVITITPSLAGRIDVVKITKWASEIKSSKTAVDAISKFYAQYPEVLLDLPSTLQSDILELRPQWLI